MLSLWQFSIIFKTNDQMKSQLERSSPGRQTYQSYSAGQSQLNWSTHSHNVVVSGMQDLSVLNKLKNVILSLRRDWISGGIKVEGREDYDKRLLLAENQIEGMLKRKINFSVKDENGERVLDYSNLLNQKENQIIELEKKIQNLQEKLRRASGREIELQHHVVKLTEDLKRKEDLISLKHNSAVAEVAASTAFRDAINKIKRNIQINRYKLGETERLVMEGVVIPEAGNFDIKIDVFNEGALSRSRHQQQPDASKFRSRLVQLFREFQRLVNQSQVVTDFQIERILEGFLSNMTETKLYEKMQYSIEKYRSMQDFKRLKENFAIAAGFFNEFVAQLKTQNASYKLPQAADNIFELLQKEKVTVFQAASGMLNIEFGAAASKVVEVPVQDARTKHLIHLLATEFKRLFLRFPKLQSEIDPKLAEFVKQEIIDVIEVDEIEKLIQIVKYIPQIVKVENVYTHCTQKERKMEFHLRVLIKALLEELEKIKIKTGVVLEIDEGVVGMIKAEIMDMVSVDDILKVFRVTPKIVEVEKIIEKIVERVIEVPKVVTVEKIVEKIVEVEKIREVQKIVHVPIEKPFIVETEREKLVPYENKIETIIEVPTIVEKIVQLEKIVSKIMEVEVIREKIVEVEVPVEVERVVNHIQTEIEKVEVIEEKIVTVEKIIQKIVEVPVFVQKIVQKIVQVPKIIEIEKIVEKIVPQIEYRSAREVQNHIQIKYQIVDRIVEKLVPIIQIKQRIKQVPREIQVIKQVTNVITEIKEVQVIRQKLVIQQRIKEVQKIVTRLVEVIKEVPKQIERYIQVPVIKEILVVRELIVQKPIIQRIESVHIKEVVIREPMIVKEPKVIEIIKYVNVYVDVPKTIKYIEEKIVEVPTIIDRIKEVPVIVEKIIEKMVEVPKVVEVEKIVEKVVVVPRVIEKVIEVPQIIEKVIEKEIIRQKIVEIERIVHVPVIQEIIKEVEVIKNIYIEVEKTVDRIIQKSVEVPRYEQKIVTHEIVKEVPITLIQEVTVQIQVEKLVPMAYECVMPIQVEKTVIVPFEIPVPVEVITEVIVPKEEIKERIIPTPQIIQKLVPVVQERVEIKEIEKIIERILIEKEIKEVEKIVPYIQEVIKEVPTIVEKIVTVQKSIDNIVTVERIIEKVIEKTNTIPQIYQVEKIREKLVQVPKLIEIEKIVPQIIRVNQYIHKIAEKLIEVPTIIETIKEIVREQEKIVAIKSETTEIVEVERCVEKLVYAEKLKEVVRNVNYIEKVLQIIDRIEQIPVTVNTTVEKFIEVPYILQKIVEKIVVMPQIVEVLKYIHQVCETEDAGVAVDIDVGLHEIRYKELSKNIEVHLDQVIKQLRYLKSDQASRSRIEVIEKFLDQLRRFILTPRIVKVVEERIVESKVPIDRIVKIPTQDEDSLKMELSLSLLTEKLIAELKRLKQKTGVNLELDEDIKLIFFTELSTNVALQGDMMKKLQSYSSHVTRQFQSLGHWTTDHQLMLNSFLQERFLMAELIQSTSAEMEQLKVMAEQQIKEANRFKNESMAYQKYLRDVSCIIAENRPFTQIIAIMDEFDKQAVSQQEIEHAVYPGNLIIQDDRIQSLLREKDAQISHLKDSIHGLQQSKITQTTTEQQGIIRVLRSEIDNIRKENSSLLLKSSESGLMESYKSQIQDLQGRNLQLEGEISRLKSENYNLENEKSLMMQNISFRRQPVSTTIQEAQVSRQSGLYRSSRVSDASQGQGQGISGSQIELSRQYGETKGIQEGTSARKPESYQQFGTVLSQSGTRFPQGSQQIGQAGQMRQSGTFMHRQGPSLQSSQRREGGQILGQQYQMTQSGMRYEGQQGFGGQGVSRSLLQPSSVPSTPIEGYKFTSPSPSGAKLTQSIIKGDESLSKFEAESPQSRQEGTPKSQSQYRYTSQYDKKE